MSKSTEEPRDESDWLDEVLEQYWKQRHGMYNANQDDVEMANREAKDAISNKIVDLVLKDRDRQKSEVKMNKSTEELRLRLIEEYMDIARGFYFEGSNEKDEREEYAPNFADRIMQLFDQEQATTEKAYGGCRNCFGKGYSTQDAATICYPDFVGDKCFKRYEHKMNFCTCERGKQLEAQVVRRVEEAR